MTHVIGRPLWHRLIWLEEGLPLLVRSHELVVVHQDLVEQEAAQRMQGYSG